MNYHNPLDLLHLHQSIARQCINILEAFLTDHTYTFNEIEGRLSQYQAVNLTNTRIALTALATPHIQLAAENDDLCLGWRSLMALVQIKINHTYQGHEPT